MRRKTVTGLAVLILLTLLAAFTFKTQTNLFAYQSFQIDSELLYIIAFSLALGAFVMFLFTAGVTRPVRELVWRTVHPAASRTGLDDLETAVSIGDYARAAEMLQHIFEDPHPAARAWKLQGDFFRVRGDWTAAGQSYEQYFDRSEGEQKAVALMLLGDLYLQQDLLERAEAAYEEAHKIVPQASEPVFRLRRIAVETGNWEAALARQEQVELQFPESLGSREEDEMRIGIRYELARQESEKASYRNAQALLKHVFRLSDAFVPAYLLSGEIYERSDNPSSALKMWEKGFRITQHPAILQRIGDAFLSRNLPERALEFFYAAVPAFGENPSLDYCFAELYLKLDLIEEGRKRFESLANRYPEWMHVQRTAADLMVKGGRMSEAVPAYKRLLDAPKESCRLWICSHCNTTYLEYGGFCTTCDRWNSIQMNLNQAGKETIEDLGKEVSYGL